MTGAALALRYAAFAAAATLANLGAQRVVLVFGEGAVLFTTAMAVGTLVGLVVKYLLDKRWIFHDASTGLRAHSTRFTLYSLMGVVTTAIFWSSETAFWLIWGTDAMREAGAILGLGVGYTVKYLLDRRFVFTDGRRKTEAA
ncbi:polysaccharide biosynthesis protein GtrA [Rhodobacteraceae bacterium WD3A24]|nr:polysaccharide biosynthesis protein GtrA [Rhodobacteraceae bacterium WD3A24]